MVNSRINGKRAASKAVVDSKMRRLGEELMVCHEQLQDAERDAKIARIVKELQDNPEKIDGCERAVMSTTFLSRETLAKTFCEDHRYLFKLPKHWMDDWLLQKLAPMLTKTIMMRLWKKDRGMNLKIFCRVTLTDRTSLIPSHDVAKCEKIMDDLFTAANVNPDLLFWSNDDVIDWNGFGVYKLEPSRPMDIESEWVYTTLVFNGGIQVSLEGSALKVTDKWTITDNWSIKRATLTPPADDALASDKLCHQLFRKNVEFEKIFKKSTLKCFVDPATVEATPEEETPSKSSTHQPESPATLQPATSSRSALSPSQLKALDQLKKKHRRS